MNTSLNIPLVSVCCISYNHEKYIRECIEGFLMQKTSFPIEIIIHDDASTDSTQDIIREYTNKDNRIIPILREQNIKSTGVAVFPITYKKARGTTTGPTRISCRSRWIFWRQTQIMG